MKIAITAIQIEVDGQKTTESNGQVELHSKPKIDVDNFLDNAMNAIVDNRMGIDKEKLKEIEAMMEEVANDDSLPPEQKTKKLKSLRSCKSLKIKRSKRR
ncbi:MAG: hypothetical protein HRU25_10705 [Psychrobium sp.]|nr:hypothetical protein [Psychrobium sp.]